MLNPLSLKTASLSALLTGLLAVTSLTMGAPQAQAQKSAAIAHQAGPTVVANAPTTMTPGAVLNGEAIRIGHMEPTEQLHLVLSIQPPHMPEEEEFIKELLTKGSPNFHKFLTPEEWNARFAPSAEDEQAVVGWAESHGLTVIKRYPNRLLVEVDGSVDTVEKAFNITMNNYQVNGEVDFSNDREPFIPSALTGILRNVLGLSNVERVHRLGVARKSSPKGALPAPGPLTGHWYGNGDPTKAPANRLAARASGTKAGTPTPSDSYPLDGGVADPRNIQSSEGYNYNAFQRLSHCCNEWGDSAGSPPESSIALIGFGAYNYSDVTTFFNNYGMAWNLYVQCFSHGGTTCPGVDDEAPLDVEYSAAMANSYGAWTDTAAIYEYEMADGYYSTYSTAFNTILSNNTAKVVSTSYGWQENVGFSGSVATGTMHPIFNNLVGTGFTLVASAGDNGASDGCGNATAVDYPASDPDFIAAGGTQLLLNSDGTFNSENAWEGEFWTGSGGACGNNHGGGGGGVSVLFFAPYWQQDPSSTATPKNDRPYYGWQGGTEYGPTEWVYTSNGRLLPDLSLTANPDVMGEWYYSGGSWQDEGGTSIVAPELAGFFAQENSYLDYVGNACGSGSSPCSPVGNPAPFIYEDGYDGAQHDPFYDTTYGCTSNNVTSADDLVYWCAYTGWDPATGWGSANMMQLAWGINWELIPAYGSPSLAFTGPATNTWFNTDQIVSWTLSDSGTPTPPGVAGFTQGWDSIPADPYSEANGGDGNSFYWGPEYPFASGGCLSFNGAGGCAGGPLQGCHTAWVEGWDNQGVTTTKSYGPVCFDNVAPTITVSNSPSPNSNGWWNTNVQVTLSPSDATSGVWRTWYTIDSYCGTNNLSACNVYSGPFTYTTEGINYIYYLTEDNAGNFSVEPYEYLYIDKTPPVTTSTLSGTVYSGSTYNGPVQVTLNPSDATSGVYQTWYKLDGGASAVYSSPFTVSTMGGHSVVYWSVDYAGNTESQHKVSFNVDSSTTLTLAATPNPQVYGTTVTMKATISAALGGTPTGAVTFWNGTVNMGTRYLYSGVATLPTTSLGAGNLTLTATYAGSGTYLPSTSASQAELIMKKPTMSSPTPGTVLAGPKVNFIWTKSDGATGYALWLGTTLGGHDVYHTATITVNANEPNSLPTNGETIYARVITYFGSNKVYNDYQYTAATQAAITSPPPGSVLAGPKVTFTWSAGTEATGYIIRIGTSVGGNQLYSSGSTTATSYTPTNLPTNGETIYVRLVTEYGTSQVWTDYTYTAAP